MRRVSYDPWLSKMTSAYEAPVLVVDLEATGPSNVPAKVVGKAADALKGKFAEICKLPGTAVNRLPDLILVIVGPPRRGLVFIMDIMRGNQLLIS